MASTSASQQSSAMKRSPNWLKMPDELMANIFQRLQTAEKLNITPKVCRTWKRICKDPATWKVIDMENLFDPPNTCYQNYDLVTLTKHAVDLSCGELTDISISYFGTNGLLDHIVLRSNKLKRLCLIKCDNITGSGLSRAVKSVPQLEELHLNGTCINAKYIGVIGWNCPQLKSFKMSSGKSVICDDHALAIANYMPELRNLELSGDSEITNDGLQAILSGCPHLESIDVSICHQTD